MREVYQNLLPCKHCKIWPIILKNNEDRICDFALISMKNVTELQVGGNVFYVADNYRANSQCHASHGIDGFVIIVVVLTHFFLQ